LAYDAASQLTEASDSDGSGGGIQYWHDNLGRTTKTIQTIDGLTPNVDLRYAYDSANNCTSLMAYLGGVLNTSNVYNAYYDNLNRLRRVYQAGAGATVTPKVAYFTFDALDRLTVINRGEYDDQTGWHSVILTEFQTGWPRAVTRPGLPQTRTCAINAFGSSSNTFASTTTNRRLEPVSRYPLALR